MQLLFFCKNCRISPEIYRNKKETYDEEPSDHKSHKSRVTRETITYEQLVV